MPKSMLRQVGRWLEPERSKQIDRGQFVGGLNFQTVYDYSYDGTMRTLSKAVTGLAWIGSTSRSFTMSISGAWIPPRGRHAVAVAALPICRDTVGPRLFLRDGGVTSSQSKRTAAFTRYNREART